MPSGVACGQPVTFINFQTGEIPDMDLDESCGNPSMFNNIDEMCTNYTFSINPSKIL